MKHNNGFTLITIESSPIIMRKGVTATEHVTPMNYCGLVWEPDPGCRVAMTFNQVEDMRIFANTLLEQADIYEDNNDE